MDLKIITVMALIIMVSGKPVEERFYVKPSQAQLQSPSMTVSSTSKVSAAQQPSIRAVSNNFPTGQATHTKYHSSSNNQQNSFNPSTVFTSRISVNSRKPHKVVIYGNPVTGEFINGVECHPSSSLNVKHQSDPVQSDFFSSKIAGMPKLESMPSRFEDHRFHTYITHNRPYSNKPYTQIIISSFANKQRPHNKITTNNAVTKKVSINEFDSFENNDFGSVAQEEIDPVQSDFTSSKMSGVLTGGPVSTSKPYSDPLTRPVSTSKPYLESTADSTVNGIIITELNNVSSMANTSVEETATTSNSVNIEKLVTSADVTTVIPSEVISPSSNSGSGQAVVGSNITKQVSIFAEGSNNASLEIDNRTKDQDSVTPSNNVTQMFLENETQKKNVSSEEISFSTNSITTQQPIIGVTSDNRIGEVISGVQNKHVTVASQSTKSSIYSGGISVSSSSVNGEEPITIVTAISPNKETVNRVPNTSNRPLGIQSSSGTSVSSSFVNGQNPVSIVWASNPTISQIQSQPFGVANRPTGDQTSSISVSSSSGNGQKPVTVVSHPQLQNVSFSGISVSSSSINGQKPVTVVSAINPTETQNKGIGEQATAGISVFSSSIGQEPATIVTDLNSVSKLNSQMQNQQQNKLTTIQPVAVVSNAQLQNKEVSISEVFSSSSSVRGQEPETGATEANSTKMQTLVLSSSTNGQQPVTFNSNSTNDLQFSNTSSTQNITSNVPVAEDFDKNELYFLGSNDFGLVTQEEVDPVQSDFIANKIAGVLTAEAISTSKPDIGSTVASNSSIIVTIDAESSNTSSMFNKIAEQKETVIVSTSVNVEEPVTIAVDTTVTPSEVTRLPNNSESEQAPIVSDINKRVSSSANLEIGSRAKDEVSDTTSNNVNIEKTSSEVITVSSGLVQEKVLEMMDINNNSSAQKASIISVNGPKSVTAVNATNLVAQQVSETSASSGEISASTSSTNEQEPETVATGNNRIRGVFSGIQTEDINIASQSSGSQVFSGGISVSSSSVNGQEPVTVVTAITPNRGTVNQIQSQVSNISNKPSGSQVSSGISVSSSSVNVEQPVTIVWASKPTNNRFQNQPLDANRPIREQISSAGVSVSSTSVNGQKPITVISDHQPQNEQASFSGISVSSSSVDGQEPVIVITAVNPASELINYTQHQQANNFIGSQSSVGSFTSASSINEEKPITVGSQPQLQNGQVQFSGVSSTTSANGEHPVAVVTTINSNHTQNQTMGEQVSAGGTLSSSSFINEQKPLTMFFPFNPFSGLISQMQNQHANKLTGSQIEVESSASSSSIKEKKPITVTTNSAVASQIQNQLINVANKPTDASSVGITVSSSSVNGQEPVTIITTSNHTTPTTGHISVPFSGVSVSTSSVNGQDPVAVVTTINSNYTQNHAIGGHASLAGTSITTSSINGQKPVTMFSSFNPVLEFISQMQNQQANKFTGGQIAVESSASSTSINEQKPLTVTTNSGVEGQMQNQFNNVANKPIGGEPSSVGITVSSSQINGQRPVAIITTSNHTTPTTGHIQVPFSGVSVSTSSVNGQDPVAAVTTINSNQTQNHAIGGQVSTTGTSISTSSINGQKPVTVFSSFNPVSELISQMQNQQAHKFTGSQIAVESSASSSSIDRQKPVTVTTNSAVEGQIQNQLINVANKPIDREASSVGITVSSSSINGQEPVAIITTSNHSTPTAGHILVPFSEISVSTSSVNGQDPVTVVTTINSNHTQNHAIGGQVSAAGTSISTSSINEQQPVTVFSSFNPVLELISQMQNQQSNKFTAGQIAVESSASSSFINKQKPVTVTTNSAVEGQIQNQLINITNKPIEGEASSVGITVSSSSINGQEPVAIITTSNHSTPTPGHVPFSGISVSTSSVNGQDPVTVVTTINSNHTQNHAIGGQVSAAGTSISTINGQKPVTVSSSLNPVAELISQMQNQQANKFTGSQISAESSASSSSFNEQKPVTVTTNSAVEGQIQNQFNNVANKPIGGEPSSVGITVSSSSINGQEPVAIITTSNHTTPTTGHIQVPFSGVSVSTSSVNGQDPVAVVTTINSNQTQNHAIGGQVSAAGTSISTSSINGQKPVTVFSSFNPVSELISQMQNQQANKFTESQISAENSASSSSINGQKPVTVTTNSAIGGQIQNQLINVANKPTEGEASLVGITVSSSSVNGQEPVTIITSNNHNAAAAGHTQNQFNNIDRPVGGVSVSSSVTGHNPAMISTGFNAPMGFFNQMQNQLFNRPMGGQMFPPFFGGFGNQQQPSAGFINQMKDQFAMNMASRPIGQQNFVGSSIETSSSSDGQKSQTTVTSTDSVTGKVTQTKYEATGGKPVAVFQTISSSVDGEKAQTVITSKNPITGEVSQTKYESSSVKNVPQESDDGDDSTSSSFVKNLEPEKASTSNLTTDELTQTRLSSSSLDSVNITVTGKMIADIINSNASLNSWSAKLNTTLMIPLEERNRSESVQGNPPKKNISDENVTIVSAEEINNSHVFIGNEPAILNTTPKTPLEERTKSKSIEVNSPSKNIADENVTTASVDTIKSESNGSVKKAVGLSIPNNIVGEDVSTGVVVSTSAFNANTPVTVLATKNPLIGASTQITYVTHPAHLINNSPELMSPKVIINPDSPVTSRSSSMKEITWSKRKYSVIDYNKPVEGGIDSSSLYNGQHSQPVVASANSLTGNINHTKYKTSGVNVPVNTRLVSGSGIFPPAKPVPKRVKQCRCGKH